VPIFYRSSGQLFPSAVRMTVNRNEHTGGRAGFAYLVKLLEQSCGPLLVRNVQAVWLRWNILAFVELSPRGLQTESSMKLLGHAVSR